MDGRRGQSQTKKKKKKIAKFIENRLFNMRILSGDSHVVPKLYT